MSTAKQRSARPPRVAEPEVGRAAGRVTKAAKPAAMPATAGTPSPLDAYLAGIDPARAPLVAELDRLVRAAAPELDVAVKYRMLTYAIGADWWRWVVAIGVTKQAVNLRFLYGTRLDAGAGALRPGTSHLATLDLAPGSPLDVDLVRRLVREAVERHPAFLAAERGARG